MTSMVLIETGLKLYMQLIIVLSEYSSVCLIHHYHDINREPLWSGHEMTKLFPSLNISSRAR